MKQAILVCFIGLLLTSPAVAGLINSGDSGTLTWASTNSPITATDGWASTSASVATSMSWSVVNSGGTWHYTYTFSADSNKKLHDFYLQVSDPFGLATQGDFSVTSAATTVRLGSYTLTDAGSLYGLGLRGGFPGNTTSWIIDVYTKYAPVWGDFYAKDGTDSGQPVFAFNSGFGPSGDSYKIAVPNAVPLPASILLGAFAVGLAGRKLRKFV